MLRLIQGICHSRVSYTVSALFDSCATPDVLKCAPYPHDSWPLKTLAVVPMKHSNHSDSYIPTSFSAPFPPAYTSSSHALPLCDPANFRILSSSLSAFRLSFHSLNKSLHSNSKGNTSSEGGFLRTSIRLEW